MNFRYIQYIEVILCANQYSGYEVSPDMQFVMNDYLDRPDGPVAEAHRGTGSATQMCPDYRTTIAPIHSPKIKILLPYLQAHNREVNADRVYLHPTRPYCYNVHEAGERVANIWTIRQNEILIFGKFISSRLVVEGSSGEHEI